MGSWYRRGGYQRSYRQAQQELEQLIDECGSKILVEDSFLWNSVEPTVHVRRLGIRSYQEVADDELFEGLLLINSRYRHLNDEELVIATCQAFGTTSPDFLQRLRAINSVEESSEDEIDGGQATASGDVQPTSAPLPAQAEGHPKDETPQYVIPDFPSPFIAIPRILMVSGSIREFDEDVLYAVVREKQPIHMRNLVDTIQRWYGRLESERSQTELEIARMVHGLDDFALKRSFVSLRDSSEVHVRKAGTRRSSEVSGKEIAAGLRRAYEANPGISKDDLVDITLKAFEFGNASDVDTVTRRLRHHVDNMRFAGIDSDETSRGQIVITPSQAVSNVAIGTGGSDERSSDAAFAIEPKAGSQSPMHAPVKRPFAGPSDFSDLLSDDFYELEKAKRLLEERKEELEVRGYDTNAVSFSYAFLREIGYRMHPDCVIRNRWTIRDDYYKTLFTKEIVDFDDIPNGARFVASFGDYLEKSLWNGEILRYGDHEWVTRAWFEEMDLGLRDILAFQRECAKRCGDEGKGVSYATVRYLRRRFPDISLFSYDFEDIFYEDALSVRDGVRSKSLQGVTVFSLDGSKNTFENLLRQILEIEGSMFLEDLTLLLDEDFGISYRLSILRNRVSQLSGLYFNATVDKLYLTYDQFYEEVE